MKFKIEKMKKPSEMTDEELEKSIKEQLLSLKFVSILVAMTAIVLVSTLFAAINKNEQQLSLILTGLVLGLWSVSLLNFDLITLKTEKRIRQVVGKWSLTA